jgi:hypothetical protein
MAVINTAVTAAAMTTKEELSMAIFSWVDAVQKSNKTGSA